MDDLLPGSFVLTLEHVLELQKGVSPVKMDFLVKLGNGLVACNLNAKFATVLMDCGPHLVGRVIALQLVGLWKRCLLIPGLHLKIMRRFLID